MRISILTVLGLLSLFTISACALGSSQSIKSSSQPIPAEERANKAMFDLTSNLNLKAEQKKSFQKVFTSFYHAMDSLRFDGSSDKKEVDRVVSQRDVELQKILTAEQFKGFKDAEIAYLKKRAEMRRNMQ